MRPLYTTTETVRGIKALAKKIKASGLRHCEALENAAKAWGYLSWRHVNLSEKHYAEFVGPAPYESHLSSQLTAKSYKEDLSRFIALPVGSSDQLSSALSEGVAVSDDLRHILFPYVEDSYGDDFDDYVVTG